MKTPKICPNCGSKIEDPVSSLKTGSTPISGPGSSPGNKNQAPAGDQKIRNPFSAAAYSFFAPGWGQWYNGETWTGLKFFVIAIVLSIFEIGSGHFAAIHLFISLLYLAVLVYAMYEAYKTAQRINTGEVPFSGKSRLFWVPEVMIILLLVVLVVSMFMVFNAGHAVPVDTNKVISVTAQKPDPSHIVVTYLGGPDASTLRYLSVLETDTVFDRPVQYIGLANQTTPVAIGSSTTFSGVNPERDHIQVTGFFSDHNPQIVFETDL